MRTPFLLLICLLTACQATKDELSGHWHSIPLEDGYYSTLDITDSTTLADKYNHNVREPVMPRFDKNGEEILVFQWEKYRDFEIRNDTLLLTESLRFVKVEEEHHLDDRFPGSLVRLHLPKSTTVSPVDLPRPSQQTDLYIGPPKNAQTDTPVNSDSTCFQTWDVTVGFDDLVHFARYEADKREVGTGYWLIIHADSTTSPATIDRLQALLEPLEFINGFLVSRFNYELDQLEYEVLDSR